MSKSLTPIDSSDFKLSPKLVEKVKQNYGETDEIRRQSIDLLRDWAEKNPRIEKIRLDTNYLLGYLRSRKFSVPMAQELIERIIIQRDSEFNERKVFKNLDLQNDEKIQNLLNRGYCVIFPKQNLSENFVILITSNAIDSSQDEFYDITRTIGLALYYALLPEVTIMKYQMVIDFKGFSSNYFKYLPDIINYIKISKPFQKLVFSFCDSIHYLNVNPIAAWFIDQIKVLFSEKIQDRIFIHTDSKFLSETNDEDNLPVEYGGKLEMKNVIENSYRIVEDFSEKLTLLIDDQLRVNLSLYPKCVREREFSSFKKTIEDIIAEEKNSKFVEFEEVRGSFKKLDID